MHAHMHNILIGVDGTRPLPLKTRGGGCCSDGAEGFRQRSSRSGAKAGRGSGTLRRLLGCCNRFTRSWGRFHGNCPTGKTLHLFSILLKFKSSWVKLLRSAKFKFAFFLVFVQHGKLRDWQGLEAWNALGDVGVGVTRAGWSWRSYRRTREVQIMQQSWDLDRFGMASAVFSFAWYHW